MKQCTGLPLEERRSYDYPYRYGKFDLWNVALGDSTDVPTVACSSVQVSDECYAMVDSGTNAVIVPQHPDVCDEAAECRVPSTKVHGPIVQTLKFKNQIGW